MTRPADDDVTLGRGLQPGDAHYRAFVGLPDGNDLAAGFSSTCSGLELREDHSLLDIGCGSLRAGRLFIPLVDEPLLHIRPALLFLAR
jgi:hypothetical protein